MELDRSALSRMELTLIFLSNSHGSRKWNSFGQSFTLTTLWSIINPFLRLCYEYRFLKLSRNSFLLYSNLIQVIHGQKAMRSFLLKQAHGLYQKLNLTTNYLQLSRNIQCASRPSLLSRTSPDDHLSLQVSLFSPIDFRWGNHMFQSSWAPQFK